MGAKPKGISGSRAAAILGMSPWATPFSVWQDIMESRQPGFNAERGYKYEPFEGNVSTRWGLAFEDAVIKLAEGHSTVAIIDREGEYQSQVEGCDFVTCHIDGMYYPPAGVGPVILHEGKTTTAFGFGDKWGEPGSDRIPIEYQIQVQHQMLCTGADECVVSVLLFPKRPEEWEAEGTKIIEEDGEIIIDSHFNGPEAPFFWAELLHSMGYFHQYIVKADKDLQEIMLDKYVEWWNKYVIGAKPPEPESYDDIKSLITAPVGTIIVDAETARMFKERTDINAEIGKSGRLSKRAGQLKVDILDRARQLEKTIDDESVDKWVFRDDRGNKVGSYYKTKSGNMTFR